MDSNLKLLPPILLNHPIIVRRERRQLLQTFWIAVTILFLWQLFTIDNVSFSTSAGAFIIAVAALIPFYLWCSGKALGMPIFPLFALTYLWTYSLPLLSNHPKIIIYSPEIHLFSSVIVAGFLVLGTFVWLQFVKSPPPIPKSYRVLRGQNSNGVFFFIIAVSIFFNMYSLGGGFALGGGAFSLIRGAILGLNVLAVFVLSYHWGTRDLSKKNSRLFFLLLVCYVITSAASLLLVGALSVVLLGVMAFVLGRQQVPWLPILLALIFILPLHYGKSDMRAKYWFKSNQVHFVQPWDYPAWYSEWIGYSIEYLNKKNDQIKPKKQSFSERSSLIHLLLMAQDKTPRDVPYLQGETYAIIPQLLIPRFLNANKIRSHEGTYLLNIHYGLQTRKATLTTTIGWGLLNEAYANFGLLGCAGLAVVLGAGYGQATRWSLHTSLLSSRSFVAVLLMGYSFQTEFSAGVYVAALFQSLVPVLIITLVFMKVQKIEDNSISKLKIDY
jgi:hypothetical protein